MDVEIEDEAVLAVGGFEEEGAELPRGPLALGGELAGGVLEDFARGAWHGRPGAAREAREVEADEVAERGAGRQFVGGDVGLEADFENLAALGDDGFAAEGADWITHPPVAHERAVRGGARVQFEFAFGHAVVADEEWLAVAGDGEAAVLEAEGGGGEEQGGC